MSKHLLLDYQAEHHDLACRLVVYDDGGTELRCGGVSRRGLLSWPELREIEITLKGLGIDGLARYFDGGAAGGTTCSLRYRGQVVRVARCTTRDLWVRFPMLGMLEDLVTRLNGWPGRGAITSRAA